METLDWFVRAWAALDGWHRAAMVVGMVLFVYGVAPALGQKKEGGGVVMEKPKIVVHGPTQIGDHNVQNNTVNVNAPAAYSTNGEVLQGTGDGLHHTVVRFPVTDGPWDASARSTFEIKLSAPFQRYELTGFPMARQNVQIGNHPDQGSLTYSTTTPPTARMVEFHFIGERPMEVVQVGVSPRR